MRNFKALGLACAAVLVSSALLASAAQAQFTSNSYPTTVTATSALGNENLTIENLSAECQSHFEGSMSEASTTKTLTVTTTNCKAFGFASATVNMNGCDFVVHSNGELDIVCPAGKAIVITAGNCEADIGAQAGRKTVALSNNGNHVDMKFNVANITVNVTKDGFLCPFNGTGHKGGSINHNLSVAVRPVSGGTNLDVD